MIRPGGRLAARVSSSSGWVSPGSRRAVDDAGRVHRRPRRPAGHHRPRGARRSPHRRSHRLKGDRAESATEVSWSDDADSSASFSSPWTLVTSIQRGRPVTFRFSTAGRDLVWPLARLARRPRDHATVSAVTRPTSCGSRSGGDRGGAPAAPHDAPGSRTLLEVPELPTDRALLEGARAGDLAAAGDLYDRYGAALYALAITVTKRAPVAEATVVEGFRTGVTSSGAPGDQVGHLLARATLAACPRSEEHRSRCLLALVIFGVSTYRDAAAVLGIEPAEAAGALRDGLRGRARAQAWSHPPGRPCGS